VCGSVELVVSEAVVGGARLVLCCEVGPPDVLALGGAVESMTSYYFLPSCSCCHVKILEVNATRLSHM
jgi:hypothetical protein